MSYDVSVEDVHGKRNGIFVRNFIVQFNGEFEENSFWFNLSMN